MESKKIIIKEQVGYINNIYSEDGIKQATRYCVYFDSEPSKILDQYYNSKFELVPAIFETYAEAKAYINGDIGYISREVVEPIL